MPIVIEKVNSSRMQDIYIYRFDREVYSNRAQKKAFRIEFVEDHTEEELQEYINEQRSDREWRFYFNSEPSGSVQRELAAALA